MKNGRRVAQIGAIGAAGLMCVLSVARRAAAQPLPAYRDSCPASQIHQPCVDSTGEIGTCVPAACDLSVDGGAPMSCTPCGVCFATGAVGDLQGCTDTIGCAPGFSCFDYGGVQLYTAAWVGGVPAAFQVYALTGECLEGGAGPVFAPSFAPCDAGAPVGLGGTASGSGSAGSGVGPTFAASSGGGASGATLPLEDAGAALPVAAFPGAPADAGPSGSALEPETIILGRGGCDVGAGAAAGALPWFALLPFWMLRRRRAGKK